MVPSIGVACCQISRATRVRCLAIPPDVVAAGPAGGLADERLGEPHRIPKLAAALAQDQAEHVTAGPDLVVMPHAGLGPSDNGRVRSTAPLRFRLGIARKTCPQSEPRNRVTCMMPKSNFGWGCQCKTLGIGRITIEERG